MFKKVLIALLLVSCSLAGGFYFYKQANSEYIGGNVLNLSYEYKIALKEGTITPAWLGHGLMLHLMYRTPFLADTKLENFTPDLVESYTVSEDGLQYDFIIKSGQTWSDGKPIRVEDFIFTYKHIAKSSHLPAVYTQAFSKIEGMSVDGNTISIFLSQRHSTLIQVLSQCPVFPEHCFSKNVNVDNFYTDPYWQNPIGSGMYMLAETVGNEARRLVINPYFNNKKPKIETILLHKGNLANNDLYLTSEIAAMVNYRSYRNYDEYSLPVNLYRYFAFNIEDRQGNKNLAMHDIETRLAIARSVDRASILENLYLDAGSLQVMDKVLKSHEVEKHSLDIARGHLAASSYDFSRPVRIAYYFEDVGGFYFVERVAKDLQEVGFKVQLVKGKSLEDLYENRNYDVLIKDFIGMQPIDRFYEYHSGHRLSNLFGINKEYDLLLENLSNAKDQEEIDRVEAQIHALSLDTMYKFPLLNMPMALYSNNVRLKLPKDLQFASPPFIVDLDVANWEIKKD